MKAYRTKDVRIKAILWDGTPNSNRAVKRLAKTIGVKIYVCHAGGDMYLRWSEPYRTGQFEIGPAPAMVFLLDGKFMAVSLERFNLLFKEDLRVRDTPGW